MQTHFCMNVLSQLSQNNSTPQNFPWWCHPECSRSLVSVCTAPDSPSWSHPTAQLQRKRSKRVHEGLPESRLSWHPDGKRPRSPVTQALSVFSSDASLSSASSQIAQPSTSSRQGTPGDPGDPRLTAVNSCVLWRHTDCKPRESAASCPGSQRHGARAGFMICPAHAPHVCVCVCVCLRACVRCVCTCVCACAELHLPCGERSAAGVPRPDGGGGHLTLGHLQGRMGHHTLQTALLGHWGGGPGGSSTGVWRRRPEPGGPFLKCSCQLSPGYTRPKV